jgi:hypothetical protein
MPETVACSCGQFVPFEDDDRGRDVYCPSCARAVAVPRAAQESAPRDFDTEVPAAPPRAEESQRPRQGIFSAAGAAAARRREVGQVVCLCGHAVVYTLDDIGSSVYCPVCQSEVQVGQRLHVAARGAPARAVSDQPPARTPSRRSRSRLSTVAWIAILGGVACTAAWTWRHHQRVLAVFGWTPVSIAPAAGPPSEFDESLLTIAMIEELATLEDPFTALIQAHAWRRGLAEAEVDADDPRYQALADVAALVVRDGESEMLAMIGALETADDAAQALSDAQSWRRVLLAYEVAGDDARLAALARTTAALFERAMPITVAAIAALADADDVSGALVEAHRWEESLAQRAAPTDDPRWAALAEVVEVLTARLVPAARETPEWAGRFRTLVQDLRAALAAGDLAQARRGRAAVEELLEEHSHELDAVDQSSYLKLKAHLARLELDQEGLVLIEDHLAQAESLLGRGRVSAIAEALEHLCRAKFLALGMAIEPDQRAELARRVDGIRAALRLAQGKRAVQDARRLDESGDVDARDRAVLRALALLPGAPDSQIADDMQVLAAWADSARQNPFAAVAGAARSQAGRQIAVRDALEEAWEAYGEADVSRMLEAADRTAAEYDSPEEAIPALQPIAEPFFDAVEFRAAQILASPPADKAQRLAELAALVERATYWRELPRWRRARSALADAAA